MRFSKPARVGAFAASTLALVSALGMATSSTGAWFSDTTSGTVTANTGRVSIAVGSDQSLTATFNNLMPGQVGQKAQMQTVTITNTGSVDADLYLRNAKPTVTCPGGRMPSNADQLIITLAGGMWGGTANSPASTEPLPLYPISKGGSAGMTLFASLSQDADNTWQGCSVSVDYDIIAQQTDAPAPTS